MPRPVQHPKGSVGLDGATFRTWMNGFAEALRHPWRFMTVDLTRPVPAPNPLVTELDRIRALASTSDPGCVEARRQLRIATLRGLAQATGKPMPELRR